VLADGLGSARIVLYGRAAWTLQAAGEVTVLEGVAERGQSIALDLGADSTGRITLTAELPTEFLCFDAELVSIIRGGAASTPDTSNPVAPEDSPSDAETPVSFESAGVAGPEPQSPAPSRKAKRPAPRRPVGQPRSPASTPRPQPDPRFEPLLAVSAPLERRRQSRISVNLLSGVARLGLVDTRVAPLDGRLVQFSGGYLQLAFSRSDLRHLRSRLEGSCMPLRLNFDVNEPPLVCAGRVRWTSALGEIPGIDELQVEVEFLPISPRDRDRIAAAAERWTRGPHPGSAGATPAEAA